MRFWGFLQEHKLEVLVSPQLPMSPMCSHVWFNTFFIWESVKWDSCHVSYATYSLASGMWQQFLLYIKILLFGINVNEDMNWNHLCSKSWYVWVSESEYEWGCWKCISISFHGKHRQLLPAGLPRTMDPCLRAYYWQSKHFERTPHVLFMSLWCPNLWFVVESNILLIFSAMIAFIVIGAF